MKRSDLIPAVLVAPVLAFVAVQALHAARATVAPSSAGTAMEMHTDAGRLAEPAPAFARPAARAMAEEPVLPHRDLSEIRHELTLGAPGTYIDEILLERDSALARWPDRVSDPVRVWIASGQGIAGWQDDFADRVREAFDEWSGLGIPVRFVFVLDSADADVHVRWVDHFDTPISGKTLWARDRNWWIVSANITLALHHSGGVPLDGGSVKAIALHEVGHLLGLDHTTDTTNIMTARVRVRDLSAEDRATMRLLYSLPPGSVKEGE
jgi:hypothetical protein